MAQQQKIGLVALFLALTVARLALAQPAAPIATVRAPELFAEIGMIQLGSDEGEVGRPVASYGVTFSIPFSLRVALDLNVQTGYVVTAMGHPRDIYRTRRTLMTPVFIRRFGNERIYTFVGAGIGREHNSYAYHFEHFKPHLTGPDRWNEISPGVYERQATRGGQTIALQAGFTVSFADGLGVRCGVYTVAYHAGVRCGGGYRLGG